MNTRDLGFSAGKGDAERSTKWRQNHDDISWGPGVKMSRVSSTKLRKVYGQQSPTKRLLGDGNTA